NEDINSIYSDGSEESIHAEWRKNAGLKRYRARAPISKFVGKNIGQKLAWLAQELREKVEYTFIKVELKKKTSESCIAIYFNKKEELKKALDLEFQNDNKEIFKLEEKVLNRQTKNKEYMHKRVIIWDLPVNIKKQELRAEIEHRYGKVESIVTNLADMWQKAHVTFVEQEDADNFLKSWSQIIGEEVVRVTPPGFTAEQLKNRGEHAVRVIGIPPGMTPAELYNGLNQIGAQTCYVPRNTFYARKRMAIVAFESEEIKNHAIGHTWTTDNFTINLLDIKIKTCRRCHDPGHLVKECPITLRTSAQTQKLQERMDKFGTQNVRGINDNLKQNMWWEFCEKKTLDIVLLTETKTTKDSEKNIFIDQVLLAKKRSQDPVYKTWWSSVLEANNNNMGSGLGLMIKTQLAQHVYKVNKFPGHGISILLSFKRKIVFQIVGIYVPNQYSNNNNTIAPLRTWLHNQISQALSNNWISILLGDWNAVSNPKIDRFPERKQTSPEGSILQSIIYNGYIDTYRFINGDKQEYSYHQYHNNVLRSQSRIDSIWVHDVNKNIIMNAKIEDTSLIIKSDHLCVTMKINVQKYCDKDNFAKYKKMNYRVPRLWNLKMADKENWEQFTTQVEQASRQYLLSHNDNNSTVESIWQSLKSILITAGNKNLPKAKEPKNRTNVIWCKHPSYPLLNLANKLYKLGRKLKDNKNLNKSNQSFSSISKIISKLAITYNVNIDPYPSNDDELNQERWIENIKQWWTITRKIVKRDLIREKQREIKQKIEVRQTMLNTKPKSMIDRVLNRESRQIVLNRIIQNQNDNTVTIITDPEQIKSCVQEHLYQWTEGTEITNTALNQRWAQQYKPITDIKDTIYNSLIATIYEDEVAKIIKLMSNNKAPGPSLIPYE
ncbi:12107_t:CDS:2, partial [Dentiscutata erythropus]